MSIAGLPIVLGASETTVRTLGFSDGAATVSTNTVASLQLGDDPLNRMTITGLRSTARAANRNDTYSASANFTFADVSLTLLGLDVPIDGDDLANGVDIPGVLRVELVSGGRERKRHRRPRSMVNGLRITVFATPNPAVVTGWPRRTPKSTTATPIGLFKGAGSVVTGHRARRRHPVEDR